MPQFENSEIVRHILQTLVNISSRKTTSGTAISTMNELIKKLEDKYDFLKHVEIKDTRFLELEDPITVLTDINKINSNDIGRALYDIIKMMNSNLGKAAGHFFFKELRNRINDSYYPDIEEMGIDLSLMQLEFEVNEMSKKL